MEFRDRVGAFGRSEGGRCGSRAILRRRMHSRPVGSASWADHFLDRFDAVMFALGGRRARHRMGGRARDCGIGWGALSGLSDSARGIPRALPWACVRARRWRWTGRGLPTNCGSEAEGQTIIFWRSRPGADCSAPRKGKRHASPGQRPGKLGTNRSSPERAAENGPSIPHVSFVGCQSVPFEKAPGYSPGTI
jgi:hypothetical protein